MTFSVSAGKRLYSAVVGPGDSDSWSLLLAQEALGGGARVATGWNPNLEAGTAASH